MFDNDDEDECGEEDYSEEVYNWGSLIYGPVTCPDYYDFVIDQHTQDGLFGW